MKTNDCRSNAPPREGQEKTIRRSPRTEERAQTSTSQLPPLLQPKDKTCTSRRPPREDEAKSASIVSHGTPSNEKAKPGCHSSFTSKKGKTRTLDSLCDNPSIHEFLKPLRETEKYNIIILFASFDHLNELTLSFTSFESFVYSFES